MTIIRIEFVALIALVVVTAACNDGPAGVPPDGAIDLALPWSQVSPESVGLDSNALFFAGELGGDIERLRSLLVVREGGLALERYYGGWAADSLSDVRSVTKSVLATLVGVAIEDGHIDHVDQPITDFLSGPDFDVRTEHSTVTIRHLLMMTSGFFWLEDNRSGYNDWILSGDHVNYLLSRPFENTPGDAFTYNSAAVHLLGVVLEAAVGRPVPAFADDVLLGPLGIGERVWEELSTGYVNGSAGIDLRARDLARLGQLYLQEGWSGSRSVVPTAWIDEVTTPRWSSFGPTGPVRNLSYGFLWWMDLDNDAYMAWGFGGQFIYVAPHLDLVVVATTDWRGVDDDIGPVALQNAVLEIIVNRILGAVQPN
jgi:CubicO group peptidase (beta-lactamase class C family)